MYAAAKIEIPRRAVIAPGDPLQEPSGTNPVSVNASPLLIRQADLLDIGIDWSAWIAVNGGKLSVSSWAAHAASPKLPVLQAVGLVDEVKHHAICILDTATAMAGDVFWIVNTVTIAGIAAGAFTMPDRTVARMLSVKVVA